MSKSGARTLLQGRGVSLAPLWYFFLFLSVFANPLQGAVEKWGIVTPWTPSSLSCIRPCIPSARAQYEIRLYISLRAKVSVMESDYVIYKEPIDR